MPACRPESSPLLPITVITRSTCTLVIGRMTGMMQCVNVSEHALGLASQIARESRKDKQLLREIRQSLGAASDNNQHGRSV